MLNIDVFDERWSIVNTLREIKKRIIDIEIDIEYWDYDKCEYIEPNKYKLLEKGVIAVGERWDENSTYFFTASLVVPESFSGKNIYLALDICGESEVYVNDIPKGSIDVEHSEVRLLDAACGGEVINIRLQSTKHAHDYVRSYRAWEQKYQHHVFNSSKLISKNRNIEEFYYLAKLVFEFSVVHREKEVLAGACYELLKNILFEIDYYESIDVLEENIAAQKNRLIDEIKRLDIPNIYGKAYFMGHSHLDLAYKWSWKETFRKIERTLSNTCEILQNYSDAVYIQSQIKIFEILKEAYPKLYNKALELIKKDRIEAVGDIYVEFDTNIPCGEAIIRQILYGKSFSRENWQKQSKVCYLPDTFGYCGILPQILIQAGYKYFVTAKLEWNDTNKPPYLFFNWKGIDGTPILTHLLASDYSGGCNIERIHKYSTDKRQKGSPKACIYQFGAGDGGGGMSEDMLMNKSALKQLDGIVEVYDMTLEKSMETLSGLLHNLTEISGELYFEKHRGVYTSQAAIKKLNRKSEIMLRNSEIVNSIALLEGFIYPQKSLEQAWKKVLFNQFHDIIAGSCIGEVAKEAAVDYKEAIDIGNNAMMEAFDKLLRKGDSIFIWNTLGWLRNAIIKLKLENKNLDIIDGQDSLEYQIVHETDGERTILLEVKDIPSIGYKKLLYKESCKTENTVLKSENTNILENNIYRIIFDELGEMISIFDKINSREVLRGKGNALIAYVDRPGYFEAWDIAADFERKAFLIQELKEMKLIEQGPIRWTMEITKSFKKSTIKQFISIYRENRAIDIRTEMDFYEPQLLLKAAFEVNIDSSYAVYDISMGSLSRAATNNNSIESAQFEVNTHKWMDLSQEDYGVSILNDCKYGCDIKNNRMRITLLKTSTFPDTNQDIGHHEFVYSLYPHAGALNISDTTKAAYELNIAAILTTGNLDKSCFSWIEPEGDNIVLETIKKAEDSNDIILRLYECNGQYGEGVIKLNFNVKKIEICNILEEEISELEINNERICLQVKPFEIVSLKIGV